MAESKPKTGPRLTGSEPPPEELEWEEEQTEGTGDTQPGTPAPASAVLPTASAGPAVAPPAASAAAPGPAAAAAPAATGEVVPPPPPPPPTTDGAEEEEGYRALPHEAPSLPPELKARPQPMRPETAATLAQAGYQLSVTDPARTDVAPPSTAAAGQAPAPAPMAPPPPAPQAAAPPAAADPPPAADPSTLAVAPPGPEAPVTPSPGAATEGAEDPTPPESPEAEDEAGAVAAEPPEALGAANLLKVLLARETLPQFGVLALLMVLFLYLSQTAKGDDPTSGDWLMALGLGGAAAYGLAGLLVLTPLKGLLRNPRVGWAVPLGLTVVLAFLLRYLLLADSDNAQNNRRLLALGLVGLFVLWQFFQAWWMRVPFQNWALRRFGFEKPGESGEDEDNGESDEGWGPVALADRWATRLAGKGPALNAGAPIIWALVGLGLFELLYYLEIFKPEEKAFFTEYGSIFRIAWLAVMILVGLGLTLMVRRMLRWAPDSGRVALFSGAFAFGYWVFLAYHGFALFWSLAQEPSFAFDLLFMLVTILVAIYSLSSRALDSGKGLIRAENVLFFGVAFGISYSAANFFLISESSIDVDPMTVGRLSHLIAGGFGALVLLTTNVSFLSAEGHLRHSGLRGLKQGFGRAPTAEGASAADGEDVDGKDPSAGALPEEKE